MAGKPKWHIEIRNYLDDELTDKDLENLKFSLKDSVLEGPRTDNSIGKSCLVIVLSVAG